MNTPLAVISSYAQMLAKQVRGDERLGPLLDKITQQTFRASGKIVNGLLQDFSADQRHRVPRVGYQPDYPRHAYRCLTIQFKDLARFSWKIELEPDLPNILGNPGKLQQVFLNLFLNAKDAMASGGVLSVKSLSNGHVEILIGDNGSGIAPEHMQRIYDPFFTTKSAPKQGQRRVYLPGLQRSWL